MSADDLLDGLFTPMGRVKACLRTALTHWDNLDDDKRKELVEAALAGAQDLDRRLGALRLSVARTPPASHAGFRS
jgi:hypothetical protein